MVMEINCRYNLQPFSLLLNLHSNEDLTYMYMLEDFSCSLECAMLIWCRPYSLLQFHWLMFCFLFYTSGTSLVDCFALMGNTSWRQLGVSPVAFWWQPSTCTYLSQSVLTRFPTGPAGSVGDQAFTFMCANRWNHSAFCESFRSV